MSWSAIGFLPADFRAILLVPHPDARGAFTEIFRQEWTSLNVQPVQWNVMHSVAGTLRGIHVHPRHKDYLVLVSGELEVGLKDLRAESKTFGRSAVVPLKASSPVGVMIPNGVAHGFRSVTDTTLVYAVTEYYNPSDELGCRWDDPDLKIPWQTAAEPILSERDRSAGSMISLVDELRWRRAARAQLSDKEAPHTSSPS